MKPLASTPVTLLSALLLLVQPPHGVLSAKVHELPPSSALHAGPVLPKPGVPPPLPRIYKKKPPGAAASAASAAAAAALEQQLELEYLEYLKRAELQDYLDHLDISPLKTLTGVSYIRNSGHDPEYHELPQKLRQQQQKKSGREKQVRLKDLSHQYTDDHDQQPVR